MKIKKVDDKPMVIHTKEKNKIRSHEPKGAKIKGSNECLAVQNLIGLASNSRFMMRKHSSIFHLRLLIFTIACASSSRFVQTA